MPTAHDSGMTAETPLRGLTADEVRQRHVDGRANTLPARSGKTVHEIIRHNVFTRINAILFVLFIMVLSTGSFMNAAFGLLIIVNSGIGIIQELRAKHTLDSLVILSEEQPQVCRDGSLVDVELEELVLDDVVRLSAGRQIMVDGTVITSDYLFVDESHLTGESNPVGKQPGDTVMSGSFVIAGTGYYTVTKVGSDSYAGQLIEEASRFTLAHSDLQAGINKILKYITWVLIPVGLATVWSQAREHVSHYSDIILSITGALVPMVPEGLVLITTTAFALGVIRLGRRHCLVQELPAIEGLARVDVVCADKTGTLTENKMVFTEYIALSETPDEATCREALAQLLAADPDPNTTARAAQRAFPRKEEPWRVRSRQPFTSAHKWSGVTFDDGSWVIGAPDVLISERKAADLAQHVSASGRRVIALCQADADVTTLAAQRADMDESEWRQVFQPVALLVFSQKIRPDAADTIAYFANEGVNVKVISGDNAASVEAVTRSLGLDEHEPVDARMITSAHFDQTVEEHHVFGRVQPDQKRGMVHALQRQGHTVAMTGDGVNDVLALKDADIGVAMGSGSSAARAVAKIVLLDDRFASLPHVVAEGRRVIGNIERVANLFLTKTIYSALLALLIIIAAVPFPFMPIHVTITGWFTIGIPAFILALPPNHARARDHFVRRIMSFALPAGIIVGLTAFFAYMTTSGWHVPDEHTQQSTAALAALIIAAGWVLCCVARPLCWWKVMLVVFPLIAYTIIFTWDVTQQLFFLDSSNVGGMLVGIMCGLGGAAAVECLWWFNSLREGSSRLLWKHQPLFEGHNSLP